VTTENNRQHLGADIFAMLRRRGGPAVVVDPKGLDDKEAD
jgi:hypothetical protein